MTLCECGCGGEASPGCRFIQGHYTKVNPPMKGKYHSKESNKKRREKAKETKRLKKLLKEGKIELPFCACGCGGRVKRLGNKYINGHQTRGENNPMFGRISGENNPMFGKPAWNKGQTKETNSSLKRQSELISGDNNPMKRSEVVEKVTGENNAFYGIDMTREKNPNWQGGISFEPYCIKFNGDFKERVREFFERECVLCGKSEQEQIEEMINDGRRPFKKLSVHHVNYDKMICCNDVKPLFVPLCIGCHMKTNSNRKF